MERLSIRARKGREERGGEGCDSVGWSTIIVYELYLPVLPTYPACKACCDVHVEFWRLHFGRGGGGGYDVLRPILSPSVGSGGATGWKCMLPFCFVTFSLADF